MAGEFKGAGKQYPATDLENILAIVVINGSQINVSGRSISVVNGKVIVDGKDVTPDDKVIRIEVQGNVETLDVDVCAAIHVTGAVRELVTASGDVRCADVLGGVRTTSGDVQCKEVRGAVETVSGDVTASVIHGKVRTVSGDVR